MRTLAMELSINPNTIQRAYGELERQGYIYSVKGRGNFVSNNAGLREQKEKELLLRQRILTVTSAWMLWRKTNKIIAEKLHLLSYNMVKR